MNRLLEESQKIKEQAERILKESNIVEILKDYGEVKVGGSYALDTMLRPDIDLFVVSSEHDWEKVLNIHARIMATKFFREFNFLNCVDFEEHEESPLKGYYLQPWVPRDGMLWKMDIWLITLDQDKTKETTEHFLNLLKTNTEKRIVILEIKEAMREGKKYINGVNGRKIYRAVLENGITNVESFKKFLEQNK